MTRIFLRRGTSSELSSVVLATGEAAYATDTKALKVGDGSNNFASLSGLGGGGGGGVSAFTALSDTPSNFSGAGSKFVKVNSGASAIEFVTVSDTDTTYTAGSGLTLTGTTFHATGTSGGGSTTFAALTDTPANFTSAGGKFVKVNSGASALEFVAGTSSGGISGVVDDTSPQLGGNLDLNSKDLTGTGDINITGSGQFSSKIQASSLVKTGGTSSQFLKADGSIDSSVYITGIASNVVSNTTVGGANTVAVTNIVTITSGNYASLGSKDANTLYFIT